MARPGWYSDHPAACTCVGCSERGGVRTGAADRRGGGQPPTRVGTSLGNGGGHRGGGGTGGGSTWKWLAAIVVGVILIGVISRAVSESEGGQPTPANVVPTGATASEATPPMPPAPSPVPDFRATTQAAIAATVEALVPTSTNATTTLTLISSPTPTPTKVPATPTRTVTKVPTVPTPVPTRAPATRPSPAPTLPVSLRDFTNGRWLEQEDPRWLPRSGIWAGCETASTARRQTRFRACSTSRSPVARSSRPCSRWAGYGTASATLRPSDRLDQQYGE